MGESKHFTFNESWWKLYQFIMVLFLKLHQFFFLIFKTLIRWRNLSLGFSLKVIFRILIFIVDTKHFILNGSWWKLSQFIMVFFLELYQFSMFSKLWSGGEIIGLKFLSKYFDENRFYFTLKVFWWEHVLFFI